MVETATSVMVLVHLVSLLHQIDSTYVRRGVYPLNTKHYFRTGADADCHTAFHVPDDNQVQRACQSNNVCISINFVWRHFIKFIILMIIGQSSDHFLWRTRDDLYGCQARFTLWSTSCTRRQPYSKPTI